MARHSLWIALAGTLALGGSLRAADDAIPLGSGVCDHTFARAGYPNEVSCLAHPTNSPAYCGYYVGGGCVLRGGPPGPLDGTWGWDFVGRPCLPHKVMLGWCFKCRYQGGSGSYRTDGRPVPNVFDVKLPHRPEECPAH